MALYSRPRNTRLLVISLVMLSLLTITVDYRGGENGPLEAVGRGGVAVVGALQGAVSHVVRPVTDWVTGVVHIGSLRSENDNLRAQIDKYQAESGENTALRAQLLDLKKLLKFREDLQLEKTVSAQVVAVSVGNFESTVTIDQGSSAGIKVDMPVVSGNGLVGHVITVAPNVSIVQLIIDPDSAVASRLAAVPRVTGIVLGQRNRPLRMDLVDPEANVVPSEQVLTSGYQIEGGKALYPPGIPIGFVSHIYTRPGASLVKTIEISPAVDFSALEFVLVILKS
jgi:rod shape-determining protein MreC